ncbi:MAG: macro domain-containing protein [Acidimicrobiia bacterium]|nr:macro domain-containing protein [Acidimicrobiia bacterium]
MAQIAVVLGDITQIGADVIVNAANRDLAPGAGVDGAIRAAGGPSITRETEKLGGVETGQAVATTAGDLPASWVVHTAGPIWGSVTEEEADTLLASCYRACLDVAADLGAKSIAFPSISTGIFGYPLARAASIATGTVKRRLENHPSALASVTFVCFDEQTHRVYRDLLGV